MSATMSVQKLGHMCVKACLKHGKQRCPHVFATMQGVESCLCWCVYRRLGSRSALTQLTCPAPLNLQAALPTLPGASFNACNREVATSELQHRNCNNKYATINGVESCVCCCLCRSLGSRSAATQVPCSAPVSRQAALGLLPGSSLSAWTILQTCSKMQVG